jgi:hypothetical protein
MADRTVAASFADAEAALAQFIAALGRRYHFVEALPPAAVLRGRGVRTHKDVSDLYLCELAVANKARLATLDAGIKHPAALMLGAMPTKSQTSIYSSKSMTTPTEE